MKESEIHQLAQHLIKAYQDKNLKSMQKYGNQLAEPLRDVYYSHPEFLKEPDIRAANRIVQKLTRAQYLKKRKVREISGGLPSLGKRR